MDLMDGEAENTLKVKRNNDLLEHASHESGNTPPVDIFYVWRSKKIGFTQQ